MITIINIEKKLRAGHVELPLNVKLRVAMGSITGIYGPSGVGKTTFLKILAGLITPDQGLIHVDNTTWLDTTSNVNLSPQQRKTGFVFQNYALFPNMTVREHLSYATKDKRYIDELLNVGQLSHLVNYRPEYLSGGQQQRLAILRAMAIKPKILLMDEPFSALDESTKQQLITDLQQLWRAQQTTVFIVTHYRAELVTLANNELNIG